MFTLVLYQTSTQTKAKGETEECNAASARTNAACVCPSGYKQEVEQEAAANGEARDALDFLFQLIYVLLLLGAGAAVDLLALTTRAVPLVSFLPDRV